MEKYSGRCNQNIYAAEETTQDLKQTKDATNEFL